MQVELRYPHRPSRTMDITEDAARHPWLNTMSLSVRDDGIQAWMVTDHYERVAPGVYEWRSADVDESGQP